MAADGTCGGRGRGSGKKEGGREDQPAGWWISLWGFPARAFSPAAAAAATTATAAAAAAAGAGDSTFKMAPAGLVSDVTRGGAARPGGAGGGAAAGLPAPPLPPPSRPFLGRVPAGLTRAARCLCEAGLASLGRRCARSRRPSPRVLLRTTAPTLAPLLDPGVGSAVRSPRPRAGLRGVLCFFREYPYCYLTDRHWVSPEHREIKGRWCLLAAQTR